MDHVIVNGEFQKRSETKIDIEDRGFQFGDGVYEVIRVYNGKMFTAAEHLQRLSASCRKIGMEVPYPAAKIEELLNELIKRNKLVLGIIYLQITRGHSPRSHAFPGGDVPKTFIAYTREAQRPVENMKLGVKAILIEDIRWLRCDIKSLNLLGNLLAKQKAVEAGCFEAIQYREGIVTEGSLSNISIVKDSKVITHPANNLILNGITRQKVLEICQTNGILCEEKAFTVEDLLNADEVFLSGTTVEITPIVTIEGKKAGSGAVGPITKKLQRLLEMEIMKECGSLS